MLRRKFETGQGWKHSPLCRNNGLIFENKLSLINSIDVERTGFSIMNTSA